MKPALASDIFVGEHLARNAAEDEFIQSYIQGIGPRACGLRFRFLSACLGGWLAVCLPMTVQLEALVVLLSGRVRYMVL